MIKYRLIIFIFLFSIGFTWAQEVEGQDSSTKKNETNNSLKWKDFRQFFNDDESIKKMNDDSKESVKISDKFKEQFTNNYFRIDTDGSSLWNGKHWNAEDFPLDIYIVKTSSKYYTEFYKQYLDYAINIWESADSRIDFRYTTEISKADIVITFENDLKDKYGENYLGLTNYDLYADKKIRRVSIEFSLIKNSDEVLTSGEIKATVIHELGHALGLGHSENSFDLMFPFIDPHSSPEMTYKELSSGDNEAVKSVVNLGYGHREMQAARYQVVK